MRYQKKYPDTLTSTCPQCGRAYTYYRASRSGLTYNLDPDETLNPCCTPEALSKGFQASMSKANASK